VTSISSAGFQQFPSPLQRLQNELSSEVSAGTISGSDSDALASALDDIDATLQSERTSASATDGPPSPKEMKQKIDDLIAGEVKSGKLTDDQAAELKNVFAKTFAHGPGGGPGGPGASPGGPGGPGGGFADADSNGSSTQSASADTANTLLQDFIKLLQDSQTSSGYSASGDLQSQLRSLLVDYQT